MSTMRGRPSAKTVPETRAVRRSVVDRDRDQAVVVAAASRVVSSTGMPRSLATAGAETMFTSPGTAAAGPPAPPRSAA